MGRPTRRSTPNSDLVSHRSAACPAGGSAPRFGGRRAPRGRRCPAAVGDPRYARPPRARLRYPRARPRLVRLGPELARVAVAEPPSPGARQGGGWQGGLAAGRPRAPERGLSGSAPLSGSARELLRGGSARAASSARWVYASSCGPVSSGAPHRSCFSPHSDPPLPSQTTRVTVVMRRRGGRLREGKDKDVAASYAAHYPSAAVL